MHSWIKAYLKIFFINFLNISTFYLSPWFMWYGDKGFTFIRTVLGTVPAGSTDFGDVCMEPQPSNRGLHHRVHLCVAHMWCMQRLHDFVAHWVRNPYTFTVNDEASKASEWGLMSSVFSKLTRHWLRPTGNIQKNFKTLINYSVDVF